MIHASHDRGNITFAQLFGISMPAHIGEGRAPVPAHLFDLRLHGGCTGRSGMQAERMENIVQRLKTFGPMCVRDLADDYGIRVEAMHKIIVCMKADGVVRVVDARARPMMWEATDDTR